MRYRIYADRVEENVPCFTERITLGKATTGGGGAPYSTPLVPAGSSTDPSHDAADVVEHACEPCDSGDLDDVMSLPLCVYAWHTGGRGSRHFYRHTAYESS